MDITADQILAIMPNAHERASLFAAPLSAAMTRFGIDTPNRAAMFLAQVAHESGELRWLRELWGPTQAQIGYEGRRDLGNTETGDGKLFMGRGLLQITGRDAYAVCSQGLYGDDRLLTTPQVLEQRDDACLCGAWVWADFKHLNTVADTGDTAAFLLTTKRINGGTNGWSSRQSYWMRARPVLGAA